MGSMRKPLSGWGRYPVQECELRRPERYAGLLEDQSPRIARGQGRSYGDAALNGDGLVLLTERVNRMLKFDSERGVLHAESGVALAELMRCLVPRGWFPKVTPGTQYASLGGCVAADVHGKNHHRDGTFSESVKELVLLTADGKRLRCSPGRNSGAFWATVGGMGLTGTIGEVALSLRPIESAYLVAEHHPTGNLDETLAYLDDDVFDDQYTVAWIDGMAVGDSLGRGVFMRGHHAALSDLPAQIRNNPLEIPGRGAHRVPVDLPGWFMNSLFLQAFNALYYRRQGARQTPFVIDYASFFHPLDAIGDWNRLYGRSGFIQYQCVVPSESGRDTLHGILERLVSEGHGSFLAVLKKFGAEGRGLLSFPKPGYTLAVDIPRPGEKLFEILNELDREVANSGGRVYLAKDARLNPDMFRIMYPRYAEWYRMKQDLDPDWVFCSSLSRRLLLEEGP